MMQKIDGEKFQFIIPHGLNEEVERIAERHGLSKAESLRTLISVGVDVHNSLAQIGIIRLAEILEKSKQLVFRQGKLFDR